MCIFKKPVAKPRVELADIFNRHGESYLATHRLTHEQHKVFNAIRNCRTSALGGHVDACDHCGAIHCAYNSCRNRHCPKCESFKAAKWLMQKSDELLPVRYFHVVFTLPHELNHLVRYNKRILYNLLFSSAWKTVNTLGKDPKRLHGDMGMLSVLHTWGQNLSQHHHVHCVVPGGALRSTGKWTSSKKYLFPVNVLSRLFRGIFVSTLRNLHEQDQLKLPDKLTEIHHKEHFNEVLNVIMSKEWVVYAKPPFNTPDEVLNYLSRYTHKMAISNYRILACDEHSVTFKWRDYADGNKVKLMRLAPYEFIRRFLSHVVPTGFMRIRSFGFMANACKADKIPKIKKQCGDKAKKTEEKHDLQTWMLKITGKDITRCTICQKGTLRHVHEIPSKFHRVVADTS